MSAPLRTAALSDREREHLAEPFRAGRLCSAQNLPLSAQAFLAWALWDAFHRPLVWVLDGPRNQDQFFRDFHSLVQGHQLQGVLFPARETLPGRNAIDPDLVGDRLKALQQCLAQPPPPVIVTSIQALMQKTMPPRLLARHQVQIALGNDHDLEALSRTLSDMGYDFTAEVEVKGQASVRGGLLDVWPPAEAWPVRMEFFGTVVDSIRSFDPVEQRSVTRLETVSLSPPYEFDPRAPDREPTGEFLAYVPAEACWVWSDVESVQHHAELYRERIDEEALRRTAPTYRALRKRIGERFTGGQLNLGENDGRPGGLLTLDLQPCEGLPALQADVMQPDLLEAARLDYLENLNDRAAAGWDVHVFFDTEGARDRFAERHKEQSAWMDHLQVRVGALSEGFFSESLRLMVVAESDIYGRRRDNRRRLDLATRRRGPDRLAGTRLTEWTDIQPGDFVVHFDHGIGKYLGLYEIEFGGRQQEVMAIEYAAGAKLYVPVAQAHLLTRYVGVGKHRPKLHALGGRKWTRDKIATELAIRDLAANLLETQALRATEKGHAFPPDTHWQHEFEASFPYQETRDQERAIAELKEDMERSKPMDRLVCGDVGYGKTEVAMRAAFKAVSHEKQVAVLVPTTVLAQQHYDTFSARMEPFPIVVEMLSRFQTSAEQRAIVKRVCAGQVDIVIGTHRLISPDVQFKDLGLLIIDEEQRFGVEQKEHLKQLRTTVDILTLTATPIPRTLYMSLTGARDMSTIQTPPQERLPIETIVAEKEDHVVRDAILRELNRDGQVFYLHNRVKTIERTKQRLVRNVPEARVEIAHGQMPERELADVMRRFTQGEFDVLLCTTIIESGVDIPNVNTILIDRADRFGLSDLYQLRGRVGRYKHKAYAYLLLPRHGQLFDTARKRIGAIKRYSSLGAGFKLALRDLEIRGAGNLLGAAQSGHITAVGFDLYCQLLKRSVARLQGEEVPPIIDVELKLDFVDLATGSADDESSAVIPVDYIEDENLRVHAYRKIASATSEKDVAGLTDEFRDRFGPVPGAVDRLLKVAALRIVAAYRDIRHIEVRGEKAMMMQGTEYLMKNRRFPRLTAKTPGEKLSQLIEMARAVKPPAAGSDKTPAPGGPRSAPLRS